MFLTRRTALTLGLAALVAPAMIRPAGAAGGCALPDLDRGILFRRKDGTRGLARREGDGTVVIDDGTNRGERIGRRRVRHGVFETWRRLNESEQPVVGSAASEFTWTCSPKTVEPEAGGGWSGRVKETRKDLGHGADMKKIVDRRRTTWAARVLFPPGQPVNLSGCTFDTVPVEAEFRGPQGTQSRRWIHFPQIGPGLETRRDGVANGIVALTAA